MKTELGSLHRPYVREFYRGNRGYFAISMLGVLLIALTGLGISWILQEVVDSATGVSDRFSLAELALITLGLVAVDIVAYVLITWAQPRFLSRAMGQYKDYVFQKLSKKSIASMATENTALYISALSNDVASIETNYLRRVFTLVQYLIMFVGALAMMLWYSPLLLAVGLGLSLLPIAASLATGNRMAKAETVVSDRNESFLTMLKDCLMGFSLVKSFRAEKELLRQFVKANRELEGAKRRRNALNHVVTMISGTAGVIAQMGIFLVGGWLAITGRGVTGGVMLVFVQLMNFIIEPIGAVPEILASRKAAFGLIEKVAAALERNVREEGGTELRELAEGISIRGLSFEYPDGAEVLHGVDFTFEAGKSYAIVGASGSGKSTLLKLMMAGLPGYSGEILYDGAEQRDINVSALYGMLSLIQQEVFIFNATLRDNVTMFRDFPEEDVRRAIEQSGLGEFVAERGLDCQCGENGCELSGGERQRVAIARSLLRKSSVLLVDEATAALDRETAFRVMSSILGVDGLTRIVVTHAMEAELLRRYDCILTVRDGRVEESGTFEALMEKRGYFYSLYTVSQ